MGLTQKMGEAAGSGPAAPISLAGLSENTLMVMAQESHDPSMLTLLSECDYVNVRAKVADGQFTPVQVLKRLVHDENPVVRYHVVGNPMTPAAAITHCVDDKSEWVRAAMAQRESTSPEQLDGLANDPSELVLAEVAANTNTLPDALTKLAVVRFVSVHESLMQNPNTPGVALIKTLEFSRAWNNDSLAVGVASHRNTPPHILASLQHEKGEVLQAVCLNPNTPVFTLINLADRTHTQAPIYVAKNTSAPPELVQRITAGKHPPMEAPDVAPKSYGP